MMGAVGEYQPAPKPGAVCGSFLEQHEREIRLVDDVLTDELTTDIHPVTVAPDGKVGHFGWVLSFSWRC